MAGHEGEGEVLGKPHSQPEFRDQSHNRVKDENDPLATWYDYINCIEQNATKRPLQNKLAVLEDCFNKFKDIKRYQNDLRFVRICIQYAQMQDDTLRFLDHMYKKGIGDSCVDLYAALIDQYISKNRFSAAKTVYQLGSRHISSVSDLKAACLKLLSQRVKNKPEVISDALSCISQDISSLHELNSAVIKDDNSNTVLETTSTNIDIKGGKMAQKCIVKVVERSCFSPTSNSAKHDSVNELWGIGKNNTSSDLEDGTDTNVENTSQTWSANLRPGVIQVSQCQVTSINNSDPHQTSTVSNSQLDWIFPSSSRPTDTATSLSFHSDWDLESDTKSSDCDGKNANTENSHYMTGSEWPIISSLNDSNVNATKELGNNSGLGAINLWRSKLNVKCQSSVITRKNENNLLSNSEHTTPVITSSLLLNTKVGINVDEDSKSSADVTRRNVIVLRREKEKALDRNRTSITANCSKKSASPNVGDINVSSDSPGRTEWGTGGDFLDGVYTVKPAESNWVVAKPGESSRNNKSLELISSAIESDMNDLIKPLSSLVSGMNVLKPVSPPWYDSPRINVDELGENSTDKHSGYNPAVQIDMDGKNTLTTLEGGLTDKAEVHANRSTKKESSDSAFSAALNLLHFGDSALSSSFNANSSSSSRRNNSTPKTESFSPFNSALNLEVKLEPNLTSPKTDFSDNTSAVASCSNANSSSDSEFLKMSDDLILHLSSSGLYNSNFSTLWNVNDDVVDYSTKKTSASTPTSVAVTVTNPRPSTSRGKALYEDMSDDDDIQVVESKLKPRTDDVVEVICIEPKKSDSVSQRSRRRRRHNPTPGRVDEVVCLNESGDVISIDSSPRKRTLVEEIVDLVEDAGPARKRSWECPICFEQPKGQEVATTYCGHIFCKACIVGYIAMHDQCPTCRADLVGKPLITLFNFE